MNMRTLLLLCLACSVYTSGIAQVTGGQRAFEYLRMSNSPHVSALGGMVVSMQEKDVSIALQNPALLQPSMHNQLALSYNLFYAGIGIANLQYAYHVPKLKTDFAFGVQYLNYGEFSNTDIYGNQLGQVRATDYAIQFSASRRYKEYWRYGATLKWAHSSLADRSAMAVVADVGITFYDPESKWSVGLVAKNMGATLKKYNPNNSAEPLPFDLQLGVSKQLENVPLRLFMVAHHLYQWNVRYDNPADRINNPLFPQNNTDTSSSQFFDKLFRHLNFGVEILLAKRLAITASYNHLRRAELTTQDINGLAGFAFGANLYLNKFQVHFAHSYFSPAGAYNEIGLNFHLNKLFTIGKKTEPWGWNKSYE